MFPGCPKHRNTEGTLSEYSRNIACWLGEVSCSVKIFNGWNVIAGWLCLMCGTETCVPPWSQWKTFSLSLTHVLSFVLLSSLADGHRTLFWYKRWYEMKYMKNLIWNIIYYVSAADENLYLNITTTYITTEIFVRNKNAFFI